MGFFASGIISMSDLWPILQKELRFVVESPLLPKPSLIGTGCSYCNCAGVAGARCTNGE